MKLKVDYIPIEQLKPYGKNAKIHTQEQIEQIKNSIREFGMNDPIGIWGKDNLIVEGHGRLQACKELGMKEVPVIRLDDLTDEQRRAYTLVHNQTTMNTGFDLDVLNEELDNIELDMSDFGFEQDEDFISDLLDNDFTDVGQENEIFSISFNFDKQYEEQIKQYIKDVGKENLSKILTDKALEAEN